MGRLKKSCRYDSELISRAKSVVGVCLSNESFISVVSFDDNSVRNAPKWKSRIKVTKRLIGKKLKRFDGEMLINIGKPNSDEKEFLLKCKKRKQDPGKYWVSKIAAN